MRQLTKCGLGCVRQVIRAVTACLHVGTIFLLAVGSANAQSTVDYRTELASRIKTASSPTALGSDLFGDSVDWYTGAVNFRVVDVDIPGNNALPVRVARTATTRPNPVSTWPKNMGTWELELPYISAIYPVSLSWPTNRCTGPQSANFVPDNVSSDPIPDFPGLSEAFYATEYWSGQNINVPGMGQTSILWRDPAYTPAPTDGGNYKWVTNTHIQIACLPALASGQPGEGYVAVTPDGTRYYFNWLVKKPAAFAYKSVQAPPAPPAAEGYSYFLQREEYRIYASQVVDRFGNSVNYTFDGDKVTKIESSDGRVISIFYNANGRISSIEAHGSTWTYGYTTPSGSTAVFLTSVGLPDGSSWSLPSTPMGRSVIYSSSSPYMPVDTCSLPPASAISTTVPSSVTFSMSHPSGANGTFRLEPKAHYRAAIPGGYCGFGGSHTGPTIPQGIREFALVSKSISGLLLPTQNWSVAYAQPTNTTYKTVTVTNPDASQTMYTLGTAYYQNEGKLLGKLTTGNGVSENVAYLYAFNPTNPPYAYRVGGMGTYNYNTPTPTYYDDAFGSTTQVPQTDIFTSRVSDTYMRSTSVSNFDQFAKPLVVFSSNVSAGDSKYDIYTYHHNYNKWVIGQVASKTDATTGLVEEQTDYYAATALPWKKYSFGRLNNTFTYNANGTLQTVADGLNRTTTLSGWKRGFPQSIEFADQKSISTIVHDRGWIDTATDENDATTGYFYDSLGRLTSIAYPTPDTVEWNSPTIAYARPSAGAPDLGIPGGTWRRQEAIGRFRSRTYYDARWNPVLVEERDSTTGEYIYSRKAFDYEGRVIFSSYPSSSSVASAGINFTYDVLGRLTKRQTTDGITLETKEYLTGNRIRTTGAGGEKTTVTYRAYGAPSYETAIKIEGEENQVTDIARDVFGKITGVTQSGAWGDALLGISGTSSATRSFTYNANQQLCRRTDPESGSTVWGYDNAGQIIWELKGQSGTGCITSQPSNATLFGYDPRGRKETVDYPGTVDDVTYGYDDAGNLTAVTNSVASWTYGYNKRNLIETEQASIDGRTFLLNPDYNALAQKKNLDTPGRNTTYAPDAWGRPTKLNTWIANIQYHPGGLPSAYSLGNGLTFSQTLDNRLRPQWQETKDGNDWIQRFYYAYSGSDNLSSMSETVYEADYVEAYYDKLNRMVQAHGVWGGYRYAYDSLNNLRARSHNNNSLNYTYDVASNRLAGISGAQSRSYSYNNKGEITGDGTNTFSLNALGQIQSVGGVASYSYDGNGKRIKTVKGSATEYTLYDRSGTLVYSLKGNERTDYLNLGGRTLVEIKKVAGTDTVTYLHPDLLGSPRLATDASKTVLWREHFDPYGLKLNGVSEKIGYTGHVHDPETGYTYAQARFYDPLVGRFLSTDPVHFVDDNPFTFNRYSYANNNPYRYTDPTGMCIEDLCIVEGAAIYLAGSAMVEIGRQILAGQPVTDGAAPSPLPSDAVQIMKSNKKEGSTTGDRSSRAFPKGVADEIADEARDENGQTHCEKCGVETGDGPGQVKGNTDHVIPWSKGGDSSKANGQHSCETCNKSAGARDEPKTTGMDKVRERQMREREIRERPER